MGSKRLRRTLWAGLTLWVVCGPGGVERAVGGSDPLAMEGRLGEIFALDMAPGAAVVAVRGDEVVLRREFGFADLEAERPVTPHTVFYIASSTKTFVGLAARILHERGELDLGRPLSAYLPSLRMQPPLSPGDITLLDLLTHTHGIENHGPVTFRSAYTGEFTHDLLVELLAEHGPSGTGFEYGNIGYNVASLAMDAALGRSWKDVLDEEIFTPLGMPSTTGYISAVAEGRLAMPYSMDTEGFRRLHLAKRDGNMHAAGGLVSTIEDMGRWLEVHLNDGRLDGRQVVPASAVRAAHESYAEQDNEFMSFKRTGYGLGWQIGSYDGDRFLHGFGGFPGYHSHVSMLPEHRLGVAVFTNTSRGGIFLADLMARYVYDSLLGKPGVEEAYARELEEYRAQAERFRDAIRQDRERRASRPQVLPHPLEAYAGAYESPLYGRMEWKVLNGRLEVFMGPLWSAVEVYDGEADALRVELIGGGQVVVFDFGEGDRAVKLTYEDEGFRRVDR